MEVPAHIRIEVPAEEFGDAYKGQWVERRQRIGRDTHKQLEELKNIFDDMKAFKATSKIYAAIFTDWNLEDDEGPLPKPWGNPDAFRALLDSDLDLCLWVAMLPAMPMVQLVQPSKN
ncbi:unnamed protein product [marine sediment metagenome]|uniref:Uncharacterized protein n=1 Tax=marine sediment metagenome TaxID=412755 RepID=X1FKI6_9ZZZZ